MPSWLQIAAFAVSGGLLAASPLSCVSGKEPRVVSGANISFVGGAYLSRPNMLPTFAEIPPGELLSQWDGEFGFRPSSVDIVLCGSKFIVASEDGAQQRYGRLLVFGAHPGGSGPAGRGDYQFTLGPDIFERTTDGRMAVQYESYLVNDGSERYAWIAFVSDRPITCTCIGPEKGDSACEGSYGGAPVAGVPPAPTPAEAQPEPTELPTPAPAPVTSAPVAPAPPELCANLPEIEGTCRATANELTVCTEIAKGDSEARALCTGTQVFSAERCPQQRLLACCVQDQRRRCFYGPTEKHATVLEKCGKFQGQVCK